MAPIGAERGNILSTAMLALAGVAVALISGTPDISHGSSTAYVSLGDSIADGM